MSKLNISRAGVAAGVALGAAAMGAAAVAVHGIVVQVARTRSVVARVKTVRDASGAEVRVLVQGGVYQSATYT